MKKIGLYLIYGGSFLLIFTLIFLGLNQNKSSSSSVKNSNLKNQEEVKSENFKPAEKIQVFVFHSTNRCHSCITMGKYTKETLEEKFQTELQNGKIEFREINVDLPENKELAQKFKAVGSSLFINAIIDGKDNIQEEAQAWRFLGDQKVFSDYLQKKLSKI